MSTALEAEALQNRPDVKIAVLQAQFAAAAATAARAAFLPQSGGAGRLGAQWRRVEHSALRAGLSGRGPRSTCFMDSPIRRDSPKRPNSDPSRPRTQEGGNRRSPRRATPRSPGSTRPGRSEAVGRAAVAQARESQRIIRDRYEAGCTDVVPCCARPERWPGPDAESRRGWPCSPKPRRSNAPWEGDDHHDCKDILLAAGGSCRHEPRSGGLFGYTDPTAPTRPRRSPSRPRLHLDRPRRRV